MLAIAGNTGPLDVDAERVLTTARHVFGEDHTMVAAALTAVAGQLRNAGNPKAAEDLYREALDIYRAAYGDEHRTVGQALASLGIVQSLNGAKDEAQDSLQESIRIAALQPGGPTLSDCQPRRDLAPILSARGAHDEAVTLLRETLEILRSQDAEQHGEILAVLEEMLLIQFSNPRAGDLDPTFLEIVTVATQAFPAGHLVPTMAKFGRAMYLTRNARNDEAEPALREVLADLRQMESPPPIYLFMVLDALFQITRFRTDPVGRDLADSTLLQFLQVAPAVWEPNDPMIGNNYRFAARRFKENGRMSDALAIAEKYLEFAVRNGEDGEGDEAKDQVGKMILAVVAQESPATETLERALRILDSFPKDNAGNAGRNIRRHNILRIATLSRLGRDGDHAAALDQIRESTSPDDLTTLALLGQAERIIQNP